MDSFITIILRYSVLILLMWGFWSGVSAETFRMATHETIHHAFPEVENRLVLAYAALGHTLELKEVPVLRSLALSNRGDLDGELIRIRSITDYAPNLRLIDVPVAYAEVAIFTADQSNIQTIYDLAGKRIITTLGTKLPKDLSEQYGFSLMMAPSVEAAFQMASRGRGAGVLYTAREGRQILDKLNLTGLAGYYLPVGRYPLYHFVHKKNKHLIDDLLNVLRASDQL